MDPKRTTLKLDDDLLEKAQALTGIAETSPLVREALLALIQRESARRLALLGGSEPNLANLDAPTGHPPSARRSPHAQLLAVASPTIGGGWTGDRGGWTFHGQQPC